MKKHRYGFISSQKGTDRLRVTKKKKKNLSFRSILTRLGIGNSRKIAKKCKKLENNILASFQAKTGRDRLRVFQKKKGYRFDPFQPDQEQGIPKKFNKLKNIITASFQAETGRDRLRVIQKNEKNYCSDPFQPYWEQRIPRKWEKKCKKLKKHHSGLISSQNKTRQADSDTKKKKKSYRSYPFQTDLE